MNFITITNDFVLMDSFHPNEFVSIIYDSSNNSLGEIYCKNSIFYIEFVLDKMPNFLAYAVFEYFECKDKTDITRLMPYLAEFIHFIWDTLNKVKLDYTVIDNSTCSKKQTVITATNKDKWVKYLESKSNLPFIFADKFITLYLKHSYIEII